MVAYSFQRRFVNPIRLGLGLEQPPEFPLAAGPKRHTIRADRKRGHAREGDQLQLFFGLRTRRCKLIGYARCIGSWPIELVFDDDPESEGVISPGSGLGQWGFASFDAFAIGDGFESWQALKSYWQNERGVADEFVGVIIFWENCKCTGAS